MFPSEKKTKISTFKDKGAMHRELIINFIEDSNIYALKIMYHLTRYDLKLDLKEVGEMMKIQINTNDFIKICDIEMKTLKRNLKKIMKTTISLSSRDDEYVQIIPRLKINNQYIIIDMYIDVFKMLTDKFSNFVKLNNINKLMLIKKDHAIRLFAYLQQLLHNRKSGNDDFGKKIFDLRELNGFFGTNYKTLSDIKKNIFDKIYEDVNNLVPFEYDLVKENNIGRPSNIGIYIKPLTPAEVSIRATPTIILPNPSDKDNSELRNKFKFNK